MTDYRVRTFLELYRTMNYRVTAEKLNMTQPAVTQHIQMLEHEYGCRFFIYDRHKLHRTPEAEKFSVYCRGLLYNEERFRSELRDGAAPVLRVGATKTVGDFVLGDTVERYLRDPRRTLGFFVENTEYLLKKLEDGELDFALVEGNFDKTRYGSRLFRSEPFMGICAKGHRFADKTVSLEEIFNNTLITREEGSGTRSILETVLANSGYAVSCFERSVCISNFSLICRLVADNVGVSFVYKAVADAHPGDLATFRLSGMPVTHEFNFVYLKNTDADKLIDSFVGQ